MLVSLLLTLIAIASGFVLTYTFEKNEPLASRLCAGACIGFALMGMFGFVLASAFGLYATTLALTAVVTAAPLILLTRESYRNRVNDDVNQALRAISRAATHPNRWDFIYFLFYATLAIAMWLIFRRALLEEADGIATGVLNNFGDLPFHLSVITRFAYGQNFPPEDPTFAGVRFTYPFITDFISALYVRAGASLGNSLFIENYVIAVALVGVIHRFAQKLVRNRTAASITPLLVLLNGGFGWMMLWDDVGKVDGGIYQVLKRLAHSYTILPEIEKAWRWGNSITSLLLTQRGFLLGIPLAVIVVQLWWTSLQSSEGKRKKVKGKNGEARTANSDDSAGQNADSKDSLFPFSFFLLPSSRRMLAAGIIAGLLPLIHAHTFITLLMVAVFLVPWIYWRAWVAYGLAILAAAIVFLLAANYEATGSLWIKVVVGALLVGVIANLYFFLPWPHVRLWLCFFVAAIVIGGSQVLWSTHKSAIKTQSFIAWQFGWDSDQQEMFGSKPVGSQPIETVPPFSKWLQRLPYVAWFWFKNTGLFIPLLVIALVWKPDDYLVPRKLLLFYLPFTLAFFVPNFVKLAPWVWDNIKMLFYWWIVSAPIVALLVARLWEQHVGQKVLAASLLVLMTLAGALDIVPLLLQQGHYGEMNRAGVDFAESIKQSTPANATILHAPIHNTPIYLTGRRSIMGYPGHIWTHGLDYGPREQEIKQIYAGSANAPALLAKYGVDYVVIGPHEQSDLKANAAYFERYPLVVTVERESEFGKVEYHLYKIK